LCQINETDAVVSVRYHHPVMVLVQGKPVIALSHHSKFGSPAADLGLAQCLISLAEPEPRRSDQQIFKQLERDLEQLRPYLKAEFGQISPGAR
jgi:polysaccharide pyruvyl transferase WcaK-like protein